MSFISTNLFAIFFFLLWYKANEMRIVLIEIHYSGFFIYFFRSTIRSFVHFINGMDILVEEIRSIEMY